MYNAPKKLQRKREEQARIESAERIAKAAEERRKREIAARKEHEIKQQLRLKEIRENPQLFIQQNEQVRDEDGNRWIKCRFCGCIKTDPSFVEYGDNGEKNLGLCRECYRKRRKHCDDLQ